MSREDAESVLMSSSAQIGHLLFGSSDEVREFKVLNPLYGEPWVDDPENEVLHTTGTKRPKRHLKQKTITITGMGLIPGKKTATGRPSISGDVLNSLSKKDAADFGGGARGELISSSIKALVEARTINTMIGTFFENLRRSVAPVAPLGDGRIHASLNLNTETGRLSCKNPNLQVSLVQRHHKHNTAHCATAGSCICP